MKKRKKVAKATLSFALDDEDTDIASGSQTPKDDEGPLAKRTKFGKNPNVDTSFLPDREREEEERRERERLRQEFLKKQEDMKLEDIEITYSFWDGSGHRKSVVVRCLHTHVAYTLTIDNSLGQKRRRDLDLFRKVSPANSRTSWRQC